MGEPLYLESKQIMRGNRLFEIFKTEEDWTDWDKFIQFIDLVDELTPEQKELAKQALQYLRRPEVFGETFLAYARRNNHPFYGHFAPTAPWKFKWLTRFAEAMKSFRDADGFSDRVRDVMVSEPGRFDERESVIEIAYKLRSMGFKMSFDPKATVRKPRGMTRRMLPFPTTPDLLLVDEEAGEEILIEVSALSWGDLSERSSRMYRRVFDLVTTGALWRGDLYACARIYRIIEGKELDELAARIHEVINDARSNNEFRELLEEGTIVMCAAPWREKETADAWAAKYDIELFPVEAPPYTPYDPIRLKSRIQNEQWQLPEDRPGMIIITADRSLLLFFHSYEEITASLEESLHEYPKLVCAVATHTYQGGQEEGYIATGGPHTVVKRTTDEDLIEETVFSLNESSKFQLSSSVMEKVRNAFIKG